MKQLVVKVVKFFKRTFFFHRIECEGSPVFGLFPICISFFPEDKRVPSSPLYLTSMCTANLVDIQCLYDGNAGY